MPAIIYYEGLVMKIHGKYEVTQEQYEVVMGSNPSSFKGPRLPVTNVSLEDYQEFIKRLNSNKDEILKLELQEFELEGKIQSAECNLEDLRKELSRLSEKIYNQQLKNYKLINL